MQDWMTNGNPGEARNPQRCADLVASDAGPELEFPTFGRGARDEREHGDDDQRDAEHGGALEAKRSSYKQ